MTEEVDFLFLGECYGIRLGKATVAMRILAKVLGLTVKTASLDHSKPSHRFAAYVREVGTLDSPGWCDIQWRSKPGIIGGFGAVVSKVVRRLIIRRRVEYSEPVITHYQDQVFDVVSTEYNCVTNKTVYYIKTDLEAHEFVNDSNVGIHLSNGKSGKVLSAISAGYSGSYYGKVVCITIDEDEKGVDSIAKRFLKTKNVDGVGGCCE